MRRTREFLQLESGRAILRGVVTMRAAAGDGGKEAGENLLNAGKRNGRLALPRHRPKLKGYLMAPGVPFSWAANGADGDRLGTESCERRSAVGRASCRPRTYNPLRPAIVTL